MQHQYAIKIKVLDVHTQKSIDSWWLNRDSTYSAPRSVGNMKWCTKYYKRLTSAINAAKQITNSEVIAIDNDQKETSIWINPKTRGA